MGADSAKSTFILLNTTVGSYYQNSKTGARGKFGRNGNKINIEIDTLGSIVMIHVSIIANWVYSCSEAILLGLPNWPSG